jgi:adenosylcobalamin-dependent ribonucleoside-triphosphate reductase
MNRFRLSEKFVEGYKKIHPPFGFNGLGELVYQRTYSRIKSDGTNEEWFETIERVVNGTYTMQKQWIEQHGLGWNPYKAQKSAQEMYDRMFNMKFLPPGRGLWAMGSPIVEEKKLFAALNNCSFISSGNLKDSPSVPFCFLMDASMLGVGVGFDTKGAGSITIQGPDLRRTKDIFVITDDREGWVESLKRLLESYFYGVSPVEFDYTKIRKAGEPIKTFGGTSSGYKPLEQMHESLRKTLDKEIGQQLSSTTIVDIMNIIGKCVVSGNIRRTAEIVFGEPDDDDYLDLKDYEKNPRRKEFGWASNNSIFSKIGMNYGKYAERTRVNGEPGYVWIENMQGYSRMNDGKDNKDYRVAGANPCVEQSLESAEMCCLVDTFPSRNTDMEDFKRTLKFAYLYAKTVTLGNTHWPETNRVMLRNRRIGCSISGIAQFLAKYNIETLRLWLEEGYNTIQSYDEEYSNWLCIPRSIKTTSIKPSGSVSLLAGATPGKHWPESRFYIRRVRLSIHSPLIDPLNKAGYKVEPAHEDMEHTMVVEVPVDVGENVRLAKDVSMWEQLSLAAFLQRNWSDNQVSCTVTFDPETEGHQIEHALNYYQYQLKGISFLPRKKEGAYKQMPYQSITEEEYNKLIKNLKPINFKKVAHDREEIDAYCDGDTCAIKPVKKIDI